MPDTTAERLAELERRYQAFRRSPLLTQAVALEALEALPWLLELAGRVEPLTAALRATRGLVQCDIEGGETRDFCSCGGCGLGAQADKAIEGREA